MRPSPTFFVDDYVPPYEPGELEPFTQLHAGDETPDRQQGEDADPEPEYFNPRPLKSRRLETERLGEPPERATCFGCVYLGDDETLLASEHLRRLKEMARQSVGRIDMVTLAEAMHDYYEHKIRVPINAQRAQGERALPPWPASQILDHIRNHNQDPLVQQVVLLAEVQELRTDMLDCCFEVSSKTGKARPNKHNIESYEKLVKLQLHIQKQDAAKMAFYQGSANVNPEILSQGPLSTHTKRLHAYLKIK